MTSSAPVSQSADHDYDVRSLEERLTERSDRLEELHMEAAIDAQLSDTKSTLSRASPAVTAPTGRNENNNSAAKQLLLFDDYVNPHAVDNCWSPYVPTSADRIAAFVSFSGLSPADALLDIGCGDGRVCISAVKLTGCRAVGMDVSPLCIRMARSVAMEEGILVEDEHHSQCVFLEADATISPQILLAQDSIVANLLWSATVVFLYTYPMLLKKLVPLLELLMEKGSVRKVVTLTYHLPDDQVIIGDREEKHDFRLYTKISSQSSIE